MKKIGIVGTRRRNENADYRAAERAFLDVYEEGDQLVSGGCPTGGDKFAEVIAKKFGLTITIHFPDWNKHGKIAGIIRNTKIANDSDVLIAVVAPDRTGGTEDTIKKAKDKKIIIVI